MDVGSLAASFMAMQAGALQQQVATRVTKMGLDSQARVLQLLQPPQQAAVGPGVGGNLDISV